MFAWVATDTLLIVYFVLLGGGALAALGLALLGDADAPPFGAAVATVGVTCLGGAGVLALRLFGFAPGLSLLAAVLFAALSAALFGALATVAHRAAERRKALVDLVGALAQVVTPIAPGSRGTIATNGVRPSLTLSATSRHAETLPPGTTVVVTALQGEAAEVAPLPTTPR